MFVCFICQLSKLPNGNIRYKNSFFSIYIFEKGMMQTIVMDDEILVMRFMGDDYPIDTSWHKPIRWWCFHQITCEKSWHSWVIFLMHSRIQHFTFNLIINTCFAWASFVYVTYFSQEHLVVFQENQFSGLFCLCVQHDGVCYFDMIFFSIVNTF